jgi:hypothetical protein
MVRHFGYLDILASIMLQRVSVMILTLVHLMVVNKADLKWIISFLKPLPGIHSHQINIL